MKVINFLNKMNIKHGRLRLNTGFKVLQSLNFLHLEYTSIVKQDYYILQVL